MHVHRRACNVVFLADPNKIGCIRFAHHGALQPVGEELLVRFRVGMRLDVAIDSLSAMNAPSVMVPPRHLFDDKALLGDKGVFRLECPKT